MNICPTGPSKSVHATAFFNYAITNLPSNQLGVNLMMSVMFHEAFHIIYDEQSLEFKLEFAKWFSENPSRSSKYAELLFNEAITTALASGYLWNLLSKTQMPRDKWYNNKYISSMAMELYPLTLKYLNEDKQIDKPFINEYIQLFETKFPEWMSDVAQIMSDRYIICEDKSVYRAIGTKFKFRNIDEYSPVLNLESLQKMKNLPITKLVVVSKNNQESMDLIKQTFADLKDWNPAVNSDFSHAVFLADRTYLIIVNAVTQPSEVILAGVQFR